MAAGATYEPIATQTLGSATASITFSGISGSYTDLVLIVNGTAGSGLNMLMQYNSDTATNYSTTRILGDGSSATSDRITTSADMYIGVMGTVNTTNIIQIQNYSNATTYKTTLSRANSTTIWTGAFAALWRSTSAITSIKIYLASAGSFQTGTTATLYGIKAA
jgi:hypothetical protein